MSKEDNSNISEVSGVHAIHDYCKFGSDVGTKQDYSTPISSGDVKNKNVFLGEIVVPNIEAEEVLVEAIIEGHTPNLLEVKKENESQDELIDDSGETIEAVTILHNSELISEAPVNNSLTVNKNNKERTSRTLYGKSPWHQIVLLDDWTEDNVNLLIRVCSEFAEQLKVNAKKVNIWKAIKNRMHEIDPNFRKTYSKVFSQWKALVKHCKGLKRITRKRYLDGSNTSVKTPPWFSQLNLLLESLDTESWNVDENTWAQNNRNDLFFSDDDTTPASDTLRRSKRRKSVSWKLKQMDVESNFTENQTPWNDQFIELLISFRTKCEDEFSHTERTFEENWSLVQEKIHRENPQFCGNFIQCAEKWKSLVKAYYLVRTKRKLKPDLAWKWYDLMDKALWSQRTGTPDNNSTLEENQISVQGASDNFDSPKYNSEVAHSVITIQEDGTIIGVACEPSEKVYSIVTQPSVPSVSEPHSSTKLWNDQTTASLIRARGACSHETHGRKKVFWKNIRKRMLMEDPSFTGTVEQCWSKWRNLQQTYNANKRRAETFGASSITWEWFTPIDRVMKGETLLDEPMTDYETGGGISQMESDDEDINQKMNGLRLWTNKNIRLLLNIREECDHLFSSSRSVQGVWQVIRDRMAAIDPTFPGSAIECNDKFRNLLGTYRTNKRRKETLGRDHVYWRWFDDMDRIMKASQPRLNLAKMANISDIEDDSNPPIGGADNFQLSDFEAVDDYSDKLWNGHNIKLLILCREEFQDQFTKGSKNKTWEKVGKRMVQLNPEFTGTVEDCSRKWRNLVTTYRQVKRRQQLGEDSVTWQWFFLIDRFFSQKHGNNIDYLLMDEDAMDESMTSHNDNNVKRNDNLPYHLWIKEYLIRREERDRRAEEREERMLNLMEQLLSLERKRVTTMSKIMAAGTSFEKLESSVPDFSNGITSKDVVSDSICVSQEPVVYGPKTLKTLNLDTRACLLEEVRNCSERDFKNSFRVSREIFKILMHNVAYALDNSNSGGRPRLGKEYALLMSLWLLGNGNETFRTTGVKFGISESTCYRIHKLIVKRIAEMNTKYITWPTGDTMNAVRNGFNALRGEKSFPGVVGCVDGTHIAIKKQTSDPSYMNPNRHHSVILQACCDHKGLFLDVCTGWPGSYLDAAVWRASPLYQTLETEPDTIPSECHIVADFAYPLSTYLMKPFTDDGTLNAKQQQFNETLLSTWEVIEGAFALLKARWGCLKKMLDSLDLDFIKDIIMACCVLHNICLLEDDDNKYDITMDTTVELDSGLQHYELEEAPQDIAAELKRSALTELVWRKYRH